MIAYIQHQIDQLVDWLAAKLYKTYALLHMYEI